MKTYARFCAPEWFGGESLGYFSYHGNQNNHIIMKQNDTFDYFGVSYTE